MQIFERVISHVKGSLVWTVLCTTGLVHTYRMGCNFRGLKISYFLQNAKFAGFNLTR